MGTSRASLYIIAPTLSGSIVRLFYFIHSVFTLGLSLAKFLQQRVGDIYIKHGGMTTMNALSLSTSPENEAPVQELDESPISAAQEIETMLETEITFFARWSLQDRPLLSQTMPILYSLSSLPYFIGYDMNLPSAIGASILTLILTILARKLARTGQLQGLALIRSLILETTSAEWDSDDSRGQRGTATSRNSVLGSSRSFQHEVDALSTNIDKKAGIMAAAKFYRLLLRNVILSHFVLFSFFCWRSTGYWNARKLHVISYVGLGVGCLSSLPVTGFLIGALFMLEVTSILVIADVEVFRDNILRALQLEDSNARVDALDRALYGFRGRTIKLKQVWEHDLITLLVSLIVLILAYLALCIYAMTESAFEDFGRACLIFVASSCAALFLYTLRVLARPRDSWKNFLSLDFSTFHFAMLVSRHETGWSAMREILQSETVGFKLMQVDIDSSVVNTGLLAVVFSVTLTSIETFA